MKKINLIDFGVLEMNELEMLEIEGGFWAEAWQGIKNFCNGFVASFI